MKTLTTIIASAVAIAAAFAVLYGEMCVFTYLFDLVVMPMWLQTTLAIILMCTVIVDSALFVEINVLALAYKYKLLHHVYPVHFTRPFSTIWRILK